MAKGEGKGDYPIKYSQGKFENETLLIATD